MQNFQILGRKGEGTFSEVLKAEDRTTGRQVAIKCMKKRFKSMDQVNKLKEILSIRRLQSHPNIVELNAVLFDPSSGRLALVFELMDMNLYELIKDRKQYLPEDKVCSIAYQMFKGLEYVHSHGLLHRDIKPENLLYNVEMDRVKIADFGSSRGIYCNQPFTEYISTRWYRAPECLLTDGYYSFKMDLWAAGCVLFEIMALFPLFPGNSELDQIHKIHSVLGTPPKELLDKLKAKGTHMDVEFPVKKGTGLQKLVPSISAEAFDLLTKLLVYDEDERITAKEALRHPYFKKMREMERRNKPVCRKRRPSGTPRHRTPPAPNRDEPNDSADPMNNSTTSHSASIVDGVILHQRPRGISGGSSSARKRALYDQHHLPPVIDAQPPLSPKNSGCNANNLSACSSNIPIAHVPAKRYEVDHSSKPGIWKTNAGGVERRRTRRTSLPKL